MYESEWIHCHCKLEKVTAIMMISSHHWKNGRMWGFPTLFCRDFMPISHSTIFVSSSRPFEMHLHRLLHHHIFNLNLHPICIFETSLNMNTTSIMQRATPQLRFFARRTFATSSIRSTSWSPGPSPPRLPKEEQDIFDQLQKESTGAFSTPRQRPQINQSPQSSSSSQATQNAQTNSDASSQQSLEQQMAAKVKKGEELHPNVRRGAEPEFEGDVNPKTGESGGPKNEPLRWGDAGDWSYNGRVTDF